MLVKVTKMKGDDPENNERELDFIIQKIKEIHAAKKQVQNPDGTFRQIEWRDFAILRRSLAGWGHACRRSHAVKRGFLRW